MTRPMELDKSSPIAENGADESARPQWLMVERGPLRSSSIYIPTPPSAKGVGLYSNLYPGILAL